MAICMHNTAVQEGSCERAPCMAILVQDARAGRLMVACEGAPWLVSPAWARSWWYVT